MIEPEKDSKLSANVRKFEVLKEHVTSLYPKLKNCTIRSDSGKHTSFGSPLLECKIYKKMNFVKIIWKPPIFSQSATSSKAKKLIQQNNVRDYAFGRWRNSPTNGIF